MQLLNFQTDSIKENSLDFQNILSKYLKAKYFIIKQTIKNLGEYKGTLVLHPEVTKEVNIKVETTEK